MEEKVSPERLEEVPHCIQAVVGTPWGSTQPLSVALLQVTSEAADARVANVKKPDRATALNIKTDPTDNFIFLLIIFCAFTGG